MLTVFGGFRLTIRVRFAPSPTGTLHVGTARTALFNWLFARHNGGVFIIRVEDTDKERSKPEFLDDILDSLMWLGLKWDEGPGAGGDYGPYFQSQRGDIYGEAIGKLLEKGIAYYCYCTAPELDEEREKARAEKRPFRYNRRCKNLDDNQVEVYRAEGRVPAIRFAMPGEGFVAFDDMVRGQVEFEAKELDDLIIARPDGSPTYNFVCAVDDSEMAITHVIRGEDHISNTPKQMMIAEALGTKSPTFCHLPMILGPDKAKLSKRHGATSVDEYREQGFLPEAMDNFIALLGWSYDDSTELFTVPELIDKFTMDRVAKKGAVFDMEKFTWMNGVYVRGLPSDELYRCCRPWLVKAGLISADADEESEEYAANALALEQEKIKLLSDAPALIDFFFEDDFEYSEKALKNINKLENPAGFFKDLQKKVEGLEDFTLKTIEELIRSYAEELGIGAGKVIHPLRAALSGRAKGPSMFEMMELLGRERCIERLGRAVKEFADG
jgi:glutamyl-tRNA synthetase